MQRTAPVLLFWESFPSQRFTTSRTGSVVRFSSQLVLASSLRDLDITGNDICPDGVCPAHPVLWQLRAQGQKGTGRDCMVSV